jgi:hypothetical protein
MMGSSTSAQTTAQMQNKAERRTVDTNMNDDGHHTMPEVADNANFSIFAQELYHLLTQGQRDMDPETKTLLMNYGKITFLPDDSNKQQIEMGSNNDNKLDDDGQDMNDQQMMMGDKNEMSQKMVSRRDNCHDGMSDMNQQQQEHHNRINQQDMKMQEQQQDQAHSSNSHNDSHHHAPDANERPPLHACLHTALAEGSMWA